MEQRLFNTGMLHQARGPSTGITSPAKLLTGCTPVSLSCWWCNLYRLFVKTWQGFLGTVLPSRHVGISDVLYHAVGHQQKPGQPRCCRCHRRCYRRKANRTVRAGAAPAAGAGTGPGPSRGSAAGGPSHRRSSGRPPAHSRLVTRPEASHQRASRAAGGQRGPAPGEAPRTGPHTHPNTGPAAPRPLRAGGRSGRMRAGRARGGSRGASPEHAQ